MRVCYHIQSHRLPHQVARLVRRLTETTSDSLVLVSHDVAGEPLDVAGLRRLGDVHVLPARGGYGDFSHVDRYLDSVRWVREHAADVDWFANLTGQDYPVQPLRNIEAHLASTEVDGFLEHFLVPSADSPWGMRRGRDRYYFRWRRLGQVSGRTRDIARALQAVNLVQPWGRLNTSYGVSIGVRVRTTPFSAGLRCYGGSFFCTLRRACVDHVLDFCERRPDVVEHYRRVLAPEESFLQTVLVNSGRFRLVDDCKRYFDFSGTRYNHPRTLGIADLNRALASSAHFARKFDTGRDPEVLDRIDEHLAGQRYP